MSVLLRFSNNFLFTSSPNFNHLIYDDDKFHPRSFIYDCLSSIPPGVTHKSSRTTSDDSFVLILDNRCRKMHKSQRHAESDLNQQQMEIDWWIPQRYDASTSEIKRAKCEGGSRRQIESNR